DTLVIERAAFGGQAASTVRLDNVPGFPESITGSELADRFRQQAERFGVELLQTQEVKELCTKANYQCVVTGDGSEYSARAVLIASGSRYRTLEVEGEEDYYGSGVHYCATCDGPFYKGQSVAVVGGGNSAAEESLFLADIVDDVTLLVRGEELKASQIIQEKVAENPKITVRYRTHVEGFEGAESKLSTVKVRTEGAEPETLDVPGAFVFVGLDPNTSYLTDSNVTLDEQGFVLTGHTLCTHVRRNQLELPPVFDHREPAMMETSQPGVFAAGDVRVGSTKQVASAAGEGAAVALEVREYLKRQ
ncbi:MAG: FAD-dependent oxidoreductase, partial [Acidobacteriota bacterium]